MKKRYNSIAVKILFNYLRPINAAIFGAISRVYWKHQAKLNKDKYLAAKAAWDGVSNFDELVAYFQNVYKYRFDRFEGFWDHDSSEYEWLLVFGDCDDAAKYAAMKLKQFGLHAERIGILFKQKKKTCLHFDTVFELDGKTCLFNYGHILYGDSLDGAMSAFAERWMAEKVKYSTVWY